MPASRPCLRFTVGETVRGGNAVQVLLMQQPPPAYTVYLDATVLFVIAIDNGIPSARCSHHWVQRAVPHSFGAEARVLDLSAHNLLIETSCFAHPFREQSIMNTTTCGHHHVPVSTMMEPSSPFGGAGLTEGLPLNPAIVMTALVALLGVGFWTYYLKPRLESKKPFSTLPMARGGHWLWGHISLVASDLDGMERAFVDDANAQGRVGFWHVRRARDFLFGLERLPGRINDRLRPPISIHGRKALELRIWD